MRRKMCIYKCMLNVYKNQQHRQTGSRNLMGKNPPPAKIFFSYPRSPKGEGGILYYLCPSVLPSVQDIFRRIFLSNCWWQKSDIWSQASYRYTILWVAFLDPSDSYFLFATKNEHICSMCIQINKVGKQEVGIWWFQKRFPRYGVPIWSLWPT
jgi:hypothetical protein